MALRVEEGGVLLVDEDDDGQLEMALRRRGLSVARRPSERPAGALDPASADRGPSSPPIAAGMIGTTADGLAHLAEAFQRSTDVRSVLDAPIDVGHARVLVVTDEKDSELVAALRRRGATVAAVAYSGTGLGMVTGFDPQAVVFEACGRHGPGPVLARALRSDSRLRWATVFTEPQQAGTTGMDGLLRGIERAARTDLAIREAALWRDEVRAKLADLGPARLLRALSVLPGGLHVSLRSQNAKASVTMVEGRVVEARWSTIGGLASRLVDLPAIAGVLSMTVGTAVVTRVEGDGHSIEHLRVGEAMARAAELLPSLAPKLAELPAPSLAARRPNSRRAAQRRPRLARLSSFVPAKDGGRDGHGAVADDGPTGAGSVAVSGAHAVSPGIVSIGTVPPGTAPRRHGAGEDGAMRSRSTVARDAEEPFVLPTVAPLPRHVVAAVAAAIVLVAVAGSAALFSGGDRRSDGPAHVAADDLDSAEPVRQEATFDGTLPSPPQAVPVPPLAAGGPADLLDGDEGDAQDSTTASRRERSDALLEQAEAEREANPVAAIATLDRAVTIDDRNPHVFAMLSEIYLERGDAAEALHHALQAAALRPRRSRYAELVQRARTATGPEAAGGATSDEVPAALSYIAAATPTAHPDGSGLADEASTSAPAMITTPADITPMPIADGDEVRGDDAVRPSEPVAVPAPAFPGR